MKMPNLLIISRYCVWATVFVIISGLVSYLTANGQAAIGPDPASVDAQKIAIAVNTLWWSGSLGLVAAFTFVIGNRQQAEHG